MVQSDLGKRLGCMNGRSRNAGLRIVALFEGAKGVLLLAAGFGLLSLIHDDVQKMAEELVRHFHLNPARDLRTFSRRHMAKSSDLGGQCCSCSLPGLGHSLSQVTSKLMKPLLFSNACRRSHWFIAKSATSSNVIAGGGLSSLVDRRTYPRSLRLKT
jgi:hypothetical protein